jgi:o-succinylbenzoate synthase
MSKLEFFYKKQLLNFKVPATTSRGALNTHAAYYIVVSKLEEKIFGIGEAAPLKGLSIDDVPNFEEYLKHIIGLLNDGFGYQNLDLTNWPSLNFALETALNDLEHGGSRKIVENEFVAQKPIAINGLVWMNDIEKMQEEAFQKIDAGFKCIKLKIGAHDFDAECRLIERIRKQFDPFKLEIRVDANGAFLNSEALEKLNELKRFDLHSIEQPIKAQQQLFMEEICAKSPVPVALDEELIGVNNEAIEKLLKLIKPQFIVLKPTLVGGLKNCDSWINSAKKLGIGYWLTSALESNIGLNAIAQYSSALNTTIPQGLGTGSLYTNNIESPLVVQNGYLYYDSHKNWVLNPIFS